MTTHKRAPELSAVMGIILIGIVLLVGGCATPQSAFEAARTQNSREAYLNYLRQYPKSRYAQQAREDIAKLDYQSALATGTVEGFRSYLKKTPNGKYSDDIHSRLALMEQEEFEKARQEDTRQAWEAFLKRWPNSSHLAEARQYADAASMREAFAKAKQAGTSEAYEAFLKKWPDSPLAKEARSQLEALSFAAIQKNPTIASCQAYLTRFKQGKHYREVWQLLKPFEEKERIKSALTSGMRSDLASVIRDYPGSKSIGKIRRLLTKRDREVVRQCRATLGGKLNRLTSGGVFIEACGWAKITHHQAFGGDYLGILASVPAAAPVLHLDKNTFVEYADKTFGHRWVIWFPDWDFADQISVVNGTSISAVIEMPGLGKGAAWGRRSGGVSLGYGTMLFIHGRANLNWNMAYTNVGQQQGFPGVNEAGSLDVNAQLDPSARRFLLLFPKYTSPVRQISIGGHKYDIKR